MGDDAFLRFPWYVVGNSLWQINQSAWRALAPILRLHLGQSNWLYNLVDTANAIRKVVSFPVDVEAVVFLVSKAILWQFGISLVASDGCVYLANIGNAREGRVKVKPDALDLVQRSGIQFEPKENDAHCWCYPIFPKFMVLFAANNLLHIIVRHRQHCISASGRRHLAEIAVKEGKVYQRHRESDSPDLRSRATPFTTLLELPAVHYYM